MPLSGWCRIQGCYTLAQRGYVGNPQSVVEELANCCDVSSSRELRTHPPVIDGVAKSWNAGGIATSPEGRCAGSCSLEGVSHLASRPTTTVPVADLAGRPDLIERDFTADAPVPGTGGWHHLCSHPGKDSCIRQAVTGLLLEKNCWLRHGRETCEPTCLHNVLQNWWFGTASPSRV